MSVLTIHHVQITIPPSREDDARAFYCGVLGLREIEKPEALRPRGGFWVKAGDRGLHIGVDPRNGVDRAATKAHVAYLVDDLNAWRERLSDHGVRITESVPIPGYERFEFRDPFGNRIEFITAKPQAFSHHQQATNHEPRTTNR